MAGMDADQQKRLFQLSENINTSIAHATVELAATKDEATKALLAKSLTDLQRAWLVPDEQLRENTSPTKKGGQSDE
jgi:hypothetical protein